MEAEILDLIKRAKEGDKDATQSIIIKNQGLIYSIVRKIQNRGFEIEDLFQIGCIGLMKCIKNFDFNYNVKFSTYAVPMIMGEIKRYIRDDGILKVSRSLKELATKGNIEKEKLTNKLGREPTINEIADALGVSAAEMVEAFEAGYTQSIYDTSYSGEESEVLVIDRIASKEEETELVDKIALKQIIENLGARDRQIIILRYFKDKTQFEVAKRLGISQVQVSRIEKQILKYIREKFRAI